MVLKLNIFWQNMQDWKYLPIARIIVHYVVASVQMVAKILTLLNITVTLTRTTQRTVYSFLLESDKVILVKKIIHSHPLLQAVG